MKKKYKIHWGVCYPYRILEDHYHIGYLQKMNDETLSWETIHIEPIFELVSGHLHWLDGCIGRCNGYREISSKQ